MAKATQYEFETLCRAILDAVGGSQNIANVFHCITRLRIVPVNRDLVDMAKLSSIKGILKVVESSGQIQCVIGTTVPEVYNDFIAISGINPGGEVKADAADTASDAVAVQEKKQNLIIRGLNTLAACVTPYLYAIVAGGMIKGIVSLITALGLAASDSDIITVLSAVGDAPFYFMPFMAGYAAAKRFRVKEVFGLMTAGILMYSTFSAPAEGVSSYAFGFIDIPAYNYKSSLFPVILSVWFFSVIFHFIDKRMPKNLRIVFSGALSFLIAAPIFLGFLAPLGNWFASVMTGGSAGFTLLYTGGVGKSEGNSVSAALMPACTSCSATSSAMPRSNCRVMTEAPAEEKELICTRPDMEPNCVSRGAVTTAAMTSGEAPG